MTGFVYAIGDDRGRVKIGWSADPIRRLSKIASDCSSLVTLLGLVPATKEQEAEIHRLLAPWRVTREWFHLNGPVAAFVEMLSPPKPRDALAANECPSTGPLKAFRKRHILSQKQLADMLAVDRVTVARWETGRRKIEKGRLSEVAAKTGIPRSKLRPDLAALMGEAAE